MFNEFLFDGNIGWTSELKVLSFVSRCSSRVLLVLPIVPVSSSAWAERIGMAGGSVVVVGPSGEVGIPLVFFMHRAVVSEMFSVSSLAWAERVGVTGGFVVVRGPSSEVGLISMFFMCRAVVSRHSLMVIPGLIIIFVWSSIWAVEVGMIFF